MDGSVTEPACPHYRGLSRGHCYRCLHIARRDPHARFDAFVDELLRIAHTRYRRGEPFDA
jgi:hypothetical protein